MKLEGMTAVITGGTKGMGLAIATAFASEGATVVCASRKPAATTRRVDVTTEQVVHDHVDVTDSASVRSLMDRTVDRFGSVDIVVANAGVNHDGKVHRLSDQHWKDMIDTNLTGVFHCTQAAVPHMRRQGAGRIINVSSSMATRVAIGAAGYSATKAAVETFTRVSAIELGPHGILVNCLAPGILDDGMGKALTDNEKVWDAYRNRFALGRAGHVEEAARAAVFLAGADSSYVNGHVLEVNGGLLWA